jgi:hypothetical protein
MLNEFGTNGRHWSARRWARLLGLWLWLLAFGFGREEVVVVGVDGIADRFAPVVGIEGVDVFMLGDVDGLQESLGQVGNGAGGFGFYIAADNGGDEA